MRTITRIVLPVLIVAAHSAFVFAQSKPKTEPPSLLFKISGKGISKPSYIFGTIHAVCPTEMVPLETLEPYIDQTQQLAMEIDMTDPSKMMEVAKAMLMPDGKTIKDFLTPEQFAKVDELVTNALGYSVENIKTVKPSMIGVLVLTSPKTVGCSAPAAYDTELMKSAVAKKKPILGLETIAAQIQMIDSQPLEKQAKDLYELASDLPKSIANLKTLMAAYKARDTELLEKISKDQMKDDKELMARLLDDRNAAWIPKLEAAFKEKPTFVAVGAGHLGGDKGVLKLLRAKGYEVTPVKL